MCSATGTVPTFEPGAPKPPSQPEASRQPARQELRGEQQSFGGWDDNTAPANRTSGLSPIVQGCWDNPVDRVRPKPGSKPPTAPPSPPTSPAEQLNGPAGATRSASPQKSAGGWDEPAPAKWGPLQAVAKPEEAPPSQPAPKPTAEVWDAQLQEQQQQRHMLQPTNARNTLQPEHLLVQPQPKKPQASTGWGSQPGANGEGQTASQPAARDPAAPRWLSAVPAAAGSVSPPSSLFEGPRRPTAAEAAPPATANRGGAISSVANPAARPASWPSPQQPESSTSMMPGQTDTDPQQAALAQTAKPQTAVALQHAPAQGEGLCTLASPILLFKRSAIGALAVPGRLSLQSICSLADNLSK